MTFPINRDSVGNRAYEGPGTRRARSGLRGRSPVRDILGSLFVAGTVKLAAAAFVGSIALLITAPPVGATPICDEDSDAAICDSENTGPVTGDPLGGIDRNGWGYAPQYGHVTGWAVDPDSGTTPIDVRVDVFISDWRGLTTYSVTTTANRARWISGYGRAHGFDVYIPPQWVAWACVTALNTGDGADVSLGCVGLYLNS
jgi:hypothetical protein